MAGNLTTRPHVDGGNSMMVKLTVLLPPDIKQH
jgi:hypothetical protein